VLETRNKSTGIYDVVVWDIRSRSRKAVRTLHAIYPALLSPEGRTLALVLSEGLSFLTLPGFQDRPIRPHTDVDMPRMLFSPDGKTLLFSPDEFTRAQSTWAATLELWDVPTGQRRTGDLHGRSKTKIAQQVVPDGNPVPVSVINPPPPDSWVFSPDSASLALVRGGSAEIGVYDVSSNRLLWRKKPGLQNQTAVRFTPDSRFLIASREREHLYEVLDARTGETRHSFSFPPFTHEFTSDYRLVTMLADIPREPGAMEKILGNWWPFQATKSTLKQVRILDVATGQELAHLESDTLEEALLSDDGCTLVTKHQEGGGYLLRCWDIPLRAPLDLVIGFPLGVGTLGLLLSFWLSHRRRKSSAEPKTPPAPATAG
jgi:WD40 repeat protein